MAWRNSNRSQRVMYTVMAPGYDLLTWVFGRWRRRSIERLRLRAGERVLLVGAGTGLDLRYLPAGVEVVAVDLTPAMLGRLVRRARRQGRRVAAVVMDGHRLALGDETFDAVVLHLILAVIPEPARCVHEVARVLRPGGRVAVLDKFLPDGTHVPWVLRGINRVIGLLGTEVTRQLGPMLPGSGLRVGESEGGYLRLVGLKKDR